MPIVGAPSTTALVVLDPVSEDAANVEVALSGNYGLLAHAYPAPPVSAQWASSVSTEGSVLSSARHENRVITVTVDVTGLGALQALEAKLAKLYRDGGTLKRIDSDGREIVFDVLIMDGYEPTFDVTHHIGGVTSVTFALTCAPYGRGPEGTRILHVETTLPALVFVETAIPGDMPALGRLVINDAQGADQQWVTWAIQSEHYDPASTAGLFYQAESLTPLGGSATNTGPAGASASSVMRNASLTTLYMAILSTQASGGAHLTHVGMFRVFARVQVPATNSGTVSIGLEWGVGDFRRSTRNATVDLGSGVAGTWRIVDLGLVNVPQVTTGAQRWEGRIIAKTDVVGDDIDVDWLALFPVDEGYGEARGLYTTLPAPTSFSARDEFDQTAGALTGKTLPIGGTWVGAGAATDFAVEATGRTAQRTAVSDTGITGRIGTASTPSLTDVTVQADVKCSTAGGNAVDLGIVARYVDVNNYVCARVSTSTSALFQIFTVIGGSFGTVFAELPVTQAADRFYSIKLLIDAGGHIRAWYWPQGSAPGAPLFAGYSSVLATGGTLASGKVGIHDKYSSASPAATRNYDNFAASVPPIDAAIYASQSLEIRHDQVTREDPTGSYWQPPSFFEGDYLKLPPAGAEGRSIRVIVKASRSVPATGPDTAIDDISATLSYTPRYLVVPEA